MASATEASPQPVPPQRAPPKQKLPLEPLNSNVVNYLVWRYLQEAGFGMAATWMGKEWHREPDNVMPFAPHVQPRQLVHMLQDTLLLDNIRCKGDRSKRHYYFGDDTGPDYAVPTYTISGDVPNHRYRMAKLHKNRPQLNGDIMEVDEGYGHSDQMSDTDSQPPLLDSLAITVDRGMGTEKPRQIPISSTQFLEWPRKNIITKAKWSRDEPGPLLIGGIDTFQMYAIDDSAMLNRDVQVGASPPYEVEALCWVGRDSAVASIGSAQDNHQLVHFNEWGVNPAKTVTNLSGVLFALKYQPKSRLLLCISGGVRTTMSLYQVSDTSLTYLTSKDFDNFSLFDAAWMTPTRFITCGTNTLQIYSYDLTSHTLSLNQSHDMQKSWFKLAYDPISRLAVFASEDNTLLRQYNTETDDTRTQAFTDSKLNFFTFQPLPPSSPIPSRRLLATCTEDGTIQLWDALSPFTCVRRFSLHAQGYTGPIMALAWSPDGRYLAGGGFDSVGIWDANGECKAVWMCRDRVRWKVDASDDEAEWVHHLGWDVVGDKLIFSAFDQACVIDVGQLS